MAAPTALESVVTADPGTSGEKIANISAQEDASIEILAGFALSDRIAATSTAHRTVSTADADTDMSTGDFAGTAGADLQAINNRGALSIWCHTCSSAESATLRVVYYESNNQPLFTGPVLSLSALSSFMTFSTGAWMTEPQLVESYGASKYKIYCVSKGTTKQMDIFAHPI